MRKYKRFFKIPLNKLPWKLPPSRKKKSTSSDINGTQQTKSSSWKSSKEIDQKILMEILKIIHYHKYRTTSNTYIPVFYIASTRAGKAGFPAQSISYDKLDSIYTDLAPQVHINTKMNRKGLTLPVVEYGYESYDPKIHRINRVSFRRMVIDPDSPFKKKTGKIINFQVSQYNWCIDVPCGIGRRSFPDICLLIDTSGSMRDGGYHTDIPWGEKSGYHYALLGLYGIIKYLDNEDIASSILWNIINFSDTTRASGWKTYQEIAQLKRHALTPQFGGTEINIDILRRELTREPCLVIILSDGEIYNWGKIKTDMEEIIQPHYVSFIQIGKETRVGKDMRNFGAVVLTVRRKEDISELMVNVTKQVRYSL